MQEIYTVKVPLNHAPSSEEMAAALNIENNLNIDSIDLASVVNSSIDTTAESGTDKVDTYNEPPPKSTRHSCPDWLENLQANFKEAIISPCSSKTVRAVESNRIIVSPKEHSEVRNEILNSVTTKLKTIFSLEDMPGFIFGFEVCPYCIECFRSCFDA